MSCVTYIRTYWRPLTMRWLVLAFAMALIVTISGGSLLTDWPLVIVFSGMLNIAWTWVA